MKRLLIGLLPVTLALAPASGWACAACFGQDSGPMAQGMNAGILSLLGIIIVTLLSVAGFFIYLSRKSARPVAAPAARPVLTPSPVAAD